MQILLALIHCPPACQARLRNRDKFINIEYVNPYEGDYLQFEMEDRNIMKAKLDPETTQAARERIQKKLARLRRGEHLKGDE